MYQRGYATASCRYICQPSHNLAFTTKIQELHHMLLAERLWRPHSSVPLHSKDEDAAAPVYSDMFACWLSCSLLQPVAAANYVQILIAPYMARNSAMPSPKACQTVPDAWLELSTAVQSAFTWLSFRCHGDQNMPRNQLFAQVVLRVDRKNKGMSQTKGGLISTITRLDAILANQGPDVARAMCMKHE